MGNIPVDFLYVLMLLIHWPNAAKRSASSDGNNDNVSSLDCRRKSQQLINHLKCVKVEATGNNSNKSKFV
jgi:hypothetical protein